jgi:hypothetical protein
MRKTALAALVVLMGLGAPAEAAAPKVRQLVVFRDGSATSETVSTRATRVRVEGRRCTAGDGTALAGLVRSRPGRIRLRDFGACSTRARDGGGLFVEAIRGDQAATSTQFWELGVNFADATTGGCQTRVHQGDEVLWVFDGFSKTHYLKLAGPGAATTGAPVTVTVTDGAGAPLSRAAVGGTETGADGKATLSFAEAGVYRLKAERADSVRSNSISVCIDPPGADPCTSGDKAAPRVLDVVLPGRELVSERGKSRTMVVSWQADDGSGAGVAYYAVDVRDVASGVRASQSDWRPITDRTATPSARFRGESGKAYQFRVTAVDRATNRGMAESNTIVVPVDDRDRKLLRFSHGWRRTPRASAWGATVRRTTEAGATAALRFKGRRASLIGQRLRRGGRLRVSVDGRSKVVNVRGRPAPRQVLWTSRRMRDGAHVLRIRSLGGGPVEVDAVAPRP